MQWYQWNFGGMHFLWWMFWVVMFISIFSWWTPVSRSRMRVYLDEPLKILQRRLASGEITTDEYEEHKARIQRDTPRSTSQQGRFDRDVPA